MEDTEICKNTKKIEKKISFFKAPLPHILLPQKAIIQSTQPIFWNLDIQNIEKYEEFGETYFLSKSPLHRCTTGLPKTPLF